MRHARSRICALAMTGLAFAGGCAGKQSSGQAPPPATPCEQVVPECHAKRLPNDTLTEGETSGALAPVDGLSLDGIISFDEALFRGWQEDGHVAETVQVVLGSADATELHWGDGTNLYYAIEWTGVCVRGHGPPAGYSPPASLPTCAAVTWGTVIEAHTGAFIVGGTG